MKREFIKSPLTSDWAFWIWVAYSIFIWISQITGRVPMGSGIAGLFDIAFTPVITATVVLVIVVIPRFIFLIIKDKITNR